MQKALRITLTVGALIGVVFSSTPAIGAADTSSTMRDYSTHSTVPGNFDVQYVNYQEFRSDPTFHYFFAYMASKLDPKQFNNGSNAWVGLIIDADLDNVADYQLEFSDKDLSTSLTPFNAYKKMRGDWVPMNRCGGGTYMSASSGDVTGTNRFLSFKVSVGCLELPRAFQFFFYLDANGDAERWGQEIAPDNFFQVSHDLLDRTANYRVTAGASSRTIYANPNPTVNDDLGVDTSLGIKRLNGIVQLKCNGTVRHGWVPELEVPTTLKSQGFKSLVITTYNSIESCMDERWVVVSAYSGEVVEGLITSWDFESNLATIAISPELKQLRWQGQTPRNGWLALGFGDIRSDKPTIQTSTLKSAGTNEMLFSPAIRPGSDGLPIFDSQGGVIGMVSYRGGLPQDTSMAIPVSRLCQRLLSCSGVQVWQDNPPPLPTELEARFLTATFNGASTTWPSSNRRSITSEISKLDALTVSCIAYHSARANASERAIASKRAKIVCEAIKDGTSIIVSKPSTQKAPNSSSANKVLLRFTYKPSY